MLRVSEQDLNHIWTKTSDLFQQKFVKDSDLLITGATGFFGKWLLEGLIYLNKKLDLNIHLYCLSRDPEKFLDKFPSYREYKFITWIIGDINNFKFFSKEFNYIIHAATDSDAQLYSEDPLKMLDTITLGTRRVLEFARTQKNLNSLLFVSSGAIYGKQSENVTHIDESDSFAFDFWNSNSTYAEGKRLAELYCSIYQKNYNIPVKIARCFAFVGPYLPLDSHFAIGNFINDSIKGGPIRIKSDGTSFRSYLYAADLVIWLLTILLKGKDGRQYNVGSSEEISIKNLAELISSCFNPKIKILIGEELPQGKIPERYVPSTERANRELNLYPWIDLQESIIRTKNFIIKNL